MTDDSQLNRELEDIESLFDALPDDEAWDLDSVEHTVVEEDAQPANHSVDKRQADSYRRTILPTNHTLGMTDKQLKASKQQRNKPTKPITQKRTTFSYKGVTHEITREFLLERIKGLDNQEMHQYLVEHFDEEIGGVDTTEHKVYSAKHMETRGWFWYGDGRLLSPSSRLLKRGL